MKLCPKCQKQFSDDANFCPVDAARLLPLQGETAATDGLSARFTMGERLGGSRTGAVHAAIDKQTGGRVAIKLVSPAVLQLSGLAQRLERELKQLERVQSVGIARILASGMRGEEAWIALELVPGAQTIAGAISARGPIPLDDAAHLIEVVGEALIEAAQVGVVHRDLAPKNVLFAGEDIKLINFSLPVPINDKVPGVPEFVAPEQVEGKPVDQRSNLYSLGALYYYVLTGRPVHGGSAEAIHQGHVAGTIPPPSTIAPVPPAVEAVIMRALDRSPTKRFLTVRQFVDEVGRVARGEVDPRSTQPMGQQPTKNGRPRHELVQTLLGVRSAVAKAIPGVSANAAMPAPTRTMYGHAAMQMPAAMQAPAMTAPVAVATPAVAAAPPERSPWAQPAPTPAPVHTQPGQHQAIPQQPGYAQQPAPQAAPQYVQQQQAPVAAQPYGQPPQPGQHNGPNHMQAGHPGMAATAAVAVQVPQAMSAAQPQSPIVTAPPIMAPQVTGAPVGRKRGTGGTDDAANKGKFRETMWFKKGELDASAAQAAAEERVKTGQDVVTDKADTLPIDERYKDDGSITRGDKEKYSLRTGGTQMMSAMREPGVSGTMAKVSEDALIGEMKGGRNKIFVFIGLAIIAILLIIVMVSR